jgi:diguanylate cyclase (GGDEF)-like protein/PAS domain S-box-containing protein
MHSITTGSLKSVALISLFTDPDETAWLEEHLKLARAVALSAAVLFTAYGLVDNQLHPGALANTWFWRLLGALIALSTLVSLAPQRYARWGIVHATFASASLVSIINLVFIGLLERPVIALAAQMQCLMMIAMLGPLRSLTWIASAAVLGSFNLGLALTGANWDLFIVSNVFLGFGVAVLLGISHTAHRNFRAKRQLQTLSVAQARIVQSSSDAIWGCNSDGEITSWNDGAQRLFGYLPQAALGQPVSLLFPPERYDTDNARLRKVLRGQQVENFHSEWADAHGRRHEVSVTFSPISDSQGRVLGASTIARDISDEKLAERLLHEKDVQFRTAIETSQEGFWAADTSGRIIDVNNAYCRMSGYARAELLTLRIPDLEAHENPEEAAAHIARVRRVGSDTFETMHRRANGSIWPVEVSTTYAAHGGGRFFVFIKDLTERKRVEAMAWHQANFDLLTQLPNRALLFDRLGKQCAQALRSGTPLALLFADLDGFKQVNDAYGHAAGDVVLQEVARRWLACVRAADTVARLGGDEFAVILGGSNTPQAAGTLAQKLVDTLQAPFALPGGAFATVGVSIGIAIFPTDAQVVDALISKADSAMYESKRRGKNTYTHIADTPGAGS